jgi:hypothetical protein
MYRFVGYATTEHGEVVFEKRETLVRYCAKPYFITDYTFENKTY